MPGSGGGGGGSHATLQTLEVERQALLFRLQRLSELSLIRDKHVDEDRLSCQDWSHNCIWQDQLAVREKQLERVTSELDLANNALHSTRQDLTKCEAIMKQLAAEQATVATDTSSAKIQAVADQRQLAQSEKFVEELRQATHRRLGSVPGESCQSLRDELANVSLVERRAWVRESTQHEFIKSRSSSESVERRRSIQ